MIHRKDCEIEWLEFELLQGLPVSHGIFLRHGGVSQGAFSSLNVGASVGDSFEFVTQNRALINQVFGSNKLIFGQQVHGVEIAEVKAQEARVDTCDGLITKEKGKALAIQHADCQAAIFYDPIQNILANIHCGWRGSVQNIYEKTVDLFKAKGSNSANILVCISPSLGPLAAEFIHFEKELPPSFQDFRGDGYLFDFWEISRFQLKQAGILPCHIELASICTYQDGRNYFSYRRDKITGRHATVAQLN